MTTTYEYSQKHIAAFNRWKKDGSLALTEAEVVALESEDPAFGREVREAREADRLRRENEEAARRKAATPAPKPFNLERAILALYQTHGLKADADDFDIWKWAATAENATLPAPLCLVAAVYTFCQDMNTRNVERNRRLDAIEAKLAALEGQKHVSPSGYRTKDLAADLELHALDARCRQLEVQCTDLQETVKELNERPAFSYQGVYIPGHVYKRGQFVTWRGQVWHCQEQTHTKPGDPGQKWKLAVRKGTDGRCVCRKDEQQ